MADLQEKLETVNEEVEVLFDGLKNVGRRDIKGYLTTGFFLILPVVTAVWVLVTIARWVKSLFVVPIMGIMTSLGLPEALVSDWMIQFGVGITALIIVVGLTAGLGMIASNVAGKWLIAATDNLFKQVPLINTVYKFVKGFSESFNFSGERKFEKVVAVEFPREGVWSVGFISAKVVGKFARALSGDRIAVFVPTGPNPSTGFIMLTEESKVINLDITPDEALKFIVSAGVLMPGANLTIPPETK